MIKYIIAGAVLAFLYAILITLRCVYDALNDINSNIYKLRDDLRKLQNTDEKGQIK